MQRTAKLQIGAYKFERTFDKDNKESVKQFCNDYIKFFQEYRNNHTISSRYWRFPVMYFKDGDGEFYPVYKITPNGSWEEYK